MDMILMDPEFREIGYMSTTADVEIGDKSAKNDFQIEADDIPEQGGFYVPDTEVGGMFEYLKDKTGQTSIIKGYTWRGLWAQDIVCPPPGEDHRTVSGEANAVLRQLVETSELLREMFTVSAHDSGIRIERYTFRLYCTYLDGIMDMCEKAGAKLMIYAKKDNLAKRVRLFAEIAPAHTIEGEYNEDSRMILTFVDDRMGYTHLICMGSGELQERQRIDLYVQEDGSIGMTKHYVGRMERTALYDYPNAESMEDLERRGIARLEELRSKKSMDVDAEDVEMDVGDVVRGRRRDRGMMVEAPIVRKIYKFDGDSEPKIEYKVRKES